MSRGEDLSTDRDWRESTGCTSNRPTATVTGFIGLGSNLGDRESFLRQACENLATTEHLNIARVSAIYETEPWGYREQPAFLNAVARIETSLGPLQLFLAMQRIERQMGRTRQFRWGPREIDLDLLLYDKSVVDRPGLTVPHPAMYERGFVLVPLAEIAPGLVLPTGEPIDRAAERVGPTVKQTNLHPLVRHQVQG